MKQFGGVLRSGWCALLAASATVAGPGVGAVHAQVPPTPDATIPPEVKTGLRLPDIQLHDPWIVADQSTRTYYLYSSASRRITGEGRTGTLYYTSKDLASWEGPFIAFVAPKDSWADPGVNAWAPEVHAYRGKYYLLTTLHNPAKHLTTTDSARPNTMRATMIAVSDSPRGPFTLTRADSPITPANFMTLDGTLYVDRGGKPWMVYAHEWLQKVDGTMEAIPLNEDLSAATGAPMHLFKASDAPWLNAQMVPSAKENHYVTDGPELFRTKKGTLLMLWASYMQKLVLHQPFQNARGKLYEMEDIGDRLRVVKYREDLSGPSLPPLPGQAPR